MWGVGGSTGLAGLVRRTAQLWQEIGGHKKPNQDCGGGNSATQGLGQEAEVSQPRGYVANIYRYLCHRMGSLRMAVIS